MTAFVVDAVGWLGAGALVSAYALVSSGRLQGRGISFQLLNLMGALGLLIHGVYHGAWPSAGLNTVWLVVGVAALPVSGPHTDWTAAGQPARRALATSLVPNQGGRHDDHRPA